MTPRQLAALAVRILALYCFISALSNFREPFIVLGYYLNLIDSNSGILSSFPQTHNIWSVVISLLPASLEMGFGILLWMFANAISLMMVRDEDEESHISISLDSFTIHLIAFSTVGIILISKAFPVAVQFTYEAFEAAHNSYVSGLTSLEGPQIFTAIAQTIFGLWLILGAKGIVKGIRSVRDIGRDPSL